MSYIVRYSPELRSRYPGPQKKHQRAGKLGLVLIFCLILLTAGKFVLSCPKVRDELLHQREQLEVMAQKVRESSGFSEALEAWCRDILKDENLY